MKRFLSLLTVAALVVTCVALAVFATQTPTVSVSGATAAPGETVTLSFSLSDNPGFATYRMGIQYDKNVLELKSVDAGALSAGVFLPNLDNGQVGFVNTTDINGDGVLFTATFKILATTSTTTDVGIDMNVSNLGNAAAKRLTFTVGGNTVVVRSCNDGHSWGNWTVTTKPTCTEAGEETRTCSVCNQTETRKVDATGHSWSDWTVTTKPSCTAEGVETRTCSKCNTSETRKVDATGHSWGDWTVTTKPTCTAEGVETRTCSKCNTSETRKVAATGHSWGNWTVTTKPTCTAEGVETRTCSKCNASETRKVATTGHSWGNWTVTTKPTCTAAGVETRTCSKCNASETRKVAATGHSWGEWKVTKAPTDTEHGEETRTCSKCNATETRSVAALGHTVGTEWLYDDQSHWHVCSCGEIMEKEDHKLKWVTTKEATETESGLKHQECEVCGWKGKDVEIPATGTPEPGTEPEKGCNWLLWLIIGLGVVGLFIFFIILFKRKKDDEEEDPENGPEAPNEENI